MYRINHVAAEGMHLYTTLHHIQGEYKGSYTPRRLDVVFPIHISYCSHPMKCIRDDVMWDKTKEILQ